MTPPLHGGTFSDANKNLAEANEVQMSELISVLKWRLDEWSYKIAKATITFSVVMSTRQFLRLLSK